MAVEAPLVTVVIPVWGAYAGPYLDDALESVCAQDVPARVVLIDNASETPVDGRGLAEVVRMPTRLTIGEARNVGLAAVDTAFVVFWDADDVMPPDTLGVLLAAALNDPGAVVISGVIVEAASGRRHHWPRNAMTRLAGLPALFAMAHCVSSLFPTIGVLIRMDTAVGTPGFPNRDAGDDWIFGVSLAFRGRVSFVNECTRLYRSHDQSVSFAWRYSHIVANAHGVRDRVRDDPGVPRWAKTLLPVIALLEWVVIFGLRPVARIMRRVGSACRGARHRPPSRG
jgi:glycosyltransferase involved in cell wall biosynthesis